MDGGYPDHSGVTLEGGVANQGVADNTEAWDHRNQYAISSPAQIHMQAQASSPTHAFSS